MKQGTLYIVSGPIGNISDITLRALETLKSVELILSEDTRETDKLLKHYKIEKKQLSYRDQNHERVISSIIQELQAGKDLALVSDSGTPLISDPGYKLVRDLISNGFKVSSVPGPSAVTSALSISGLPTDKFTFLGFLPKKDGDRLKLLKTYGELDSTLIIYESPYRIAKLLAEIGEALGNRKISLVREISKQYEEVETDYLSALQQTYQTKTPKGEYVVLISKENGQKDI